MKRRLALTFAGSAAIVLTAGSAAVAANLGILSSAANEPVGRLDGNAVAQLSTPAPSLDPVVVIQDEIVPVPVEDTTATEAPAPEAQGSYTGGGSSSGSSSGSGSYSGGVTSAAVRQGTPTVPPHVEDDHGGSGSSGHGGSGADD
jgi:hypothetical protein